MCFCGKESFPVILHYKNLAVSMSLNTGVILNNLGSTKFSFPKRYAIIADFMNFMQHKWNEFHHFSYREVKLDYESSPFSPSEHLTAIYAIPTQFTDSLILPVGDSRLLSPRRQGNVLLFYFYLLHLFGLSHGLLRIHTMSLA